MVDFDVFVKRFRELPKYLNSKSGDLLMKKQKEIIKLNNEQLLRGVNKEDKLMQRGYSTAYGKKRRKSGLQTSFVDLKFTGKYQDTKKGEKVKEGINIKSDVDYEKYLRGNFPDHVGLTEENAEKIAESLAEEIAKMIDKYLDK